MNENTLPHPRYELKHFPGNGRKPWAGVRIDHPGAGAEVVTWQFRDPIDAADELMSCAQSEGLPVVMPQHMKDALIAQWQQRGMGLYARGIGREWCGNSYIANGWDVAHAADIEPHRSRMQLIAA